MHSLQKKQRTEFGGVGWGGGGKRLVGLIPQPVIVIPSLIRHHEN